MAAVLLELGAASAGRDVGALEEVAGAPVFGGRQPAAEIRPLLPLPPTLP